LGFPISTTHVITSSIMGVGATKRLSAVRWGGTFTILLAWALTLPMAALLAAIVYKLVAYLWDLVMAFTLLPQDTSFFDLFDQLSAKVLDASRSVEEMLERWDRLDQRVREMK